MISAPLSPPSCGSPVDTPYELEGMYPPRKGSSEDFLSPREELLKNLNAIRERRSSFGHALDSFLSFHHRQRKKEASWSRHSDLPFWDWKRSFVDRLTKRLALPQSLRMPSDPILKRQIEHDGFIEEHVEFTVSPPFRTTALVTIPRNGAAKHPALVFLHSLGSLTLYGKEKLLAFPSEPSYLREYRNEFYDGKSLLAEFARAGYLCIAIDAIGFGERTLAAMEDFAAFDQARRRFSHAEAEKYSIQSYTELNDLWSRGFGSVGLPLASLIATDDLRTVDYLMSRSDVVSTRIGCAGLSFGSFRSHYLAALDDRIQATASVCWISTLDGIIDYNVRYSMGQFAIPSDLYTDFDIVDIPISSAPKPFLAISGWNDVLMEPRGIAQAHLALRHAWDAAGAPANLGSIVLDAPHQFNSQMQAAALGFFKTHL